MKLANAKNLNLPARALLLAALCGWVISCTKGGSITSTSTSSSGGTGTMTVTSVYPTSAGNTWVPITSAGRTYIKGLSLTIEGTCSRGINTVKIHEGSSPDYTQTAACADDGSFTWTKADYTATVDEGDKTLTITGYDSTNNVITGATTTTSVRIDNTAPAIPTVTTIDSFSATDPYLYAGATDIVTITGDVDVDTVLVTVNGTNVTPAGGHFSYDATLVPGATTPFTFTAWDIAGNSSGGPPQTHITWSPKVIVNGNISHADGVFPGAGIIADGSGATLEATVQVQPGAIVDSGTSFTLETGFNYITNSVRAQ